jgi:hypothetical protein
MTVTESPCLLSPTTGSVVRRLVVGLAVLAGVLAPMANPPATQAAPLGHPRSSLPPRPDYLVACVLEGALSRRCISQSVAAIENARRAEGMRHYKLILPRNYTSLTPAERAFVVVNLERVDRGLRPLAGMVPKLNREARAAATVGDDPNPAVWLLRGLGVHRYQSIWAQAYGVLASDYECHHRS